MEDWCQPFQLLLEGALTIPTKYDYVVNTESCEQRKWKKYIKILLNFSNKNLSQAQSRLEALIG